jgi:hypothetical protein
MSGDIPPLPNTPSWRGVQLKHRDNFIFTYTWVRRQGIFTGILKPGTTYRTLGKNAVKLLCGDLRFPLILEFVNPKTYAHYVKYRVGIRLSNQIPYTSYAISVF